MTKYSKYKYYFKHIEVPRVQRLLRNYHTLLVKNLNKGGTSTYTEIKEPSSKSWLEEIHQARHCGLCL